MTDKKKKLTVSVVPDLLEVTARLAEKAGITRAKLLENVLDVRIRELVQFEKWGVFQFGLVMRDVKDKFRDFIRSLNENPSQLIDKDEESRS